MLQLQQHDQTALLRARLGQAGFDGALSRDSTGLVSSMLESLLSERGKCAALQQRLHRQEQALWVAEQASPPLRVEVGRLVRENARLHQAMINLEEQKHAFATAEGVELSRARAEVRDLAFVCASLRRKASELEQENAGLREAASRSYELNGIVLPSGHEVRWHGRKERMEAHSPVAPAPPALAAAAPAPTLAASEGEDASSRLVPAAEPARLVRAAEGQLTSLLGRVSVADSRVDALEAALGEARSQVASRETELQRMGAELARAREAGGEADERQTEREAAQAAICQLSAQVDFLNERCVELGEKLRSQAATTKVVRLDADERQRLLETVRELRGGQQSLHTQLEAAAGVAGALAHSRPDARAPFGR